MQSCLLVSNKATSVKEYLEHRSIVEVTEEHRSLSELDFGHLGIIDVDKFIYIYYGSDDGDMGFRGDLSLLRSLLASAFFHAGEGIFILVECQNPMLEDFIRSACRDSNFVGTKLDIIHHSGSLTLSDVSKYISGSAIGSQTSSSYKSVFVTEEDSVERERFVNEAANLNSVLPVLTDQYSMYKQRAHVEAIGSARTVTEAFNRPQVLQNFTKREHPTVRQWNAFLISGEPYTLFERGAYYLIDYYERVGQRCIVVDLTSTASVKFKFENCKVLATSDIATKTQFAERVGYIKCRYNQMGYVTEMLDNVGGVGIYIFICDARDYNILHSFLSPLCAKLYGDFVTHFTEEAVQDYLDMNRPATTLFLSPAVLNQQFNLKSYREHFIETRVALFGTVDVDTTDFYECATGGQENG